MAPDTHGAFPDHVRHERSRPLRNLSEDEIEPAVERATWNAEYVPLAV